MNIPNNTTCKIVYDPSAHSDEVEVMLLAITNALMDARIPFHIGQNENDYDDYEIEVRTQDDPINLFQKQDVCDCRYLVKDIISGAIHDGGEVSIYNGEVLRSGPWPTAGVSPVYIGRIERSAIHELDALMYGAVHLLNNDPLEPAEVVNFDFRVRYHFE